MSKKSEIIKKFKGLISDLKKHNKFYYLEDSPKISDSEYDLLKRNILELEEVNPFLKKLRLFQILLVPIHQINLKK